MLGTSVGAGCATISAILDARMAASVSASLDAEDTMAGAVVLGNGGADDASPAGEIRNEGECRKR